MILGPAARCLGAGRAREPTGALAVGGHGRRSASSGDDAGARARSARRGARSTSRGRLLTPAFVDAHLHAVQAGLVMAGLDLHDAASRDRACWTGWPRTPAAHPAAA